MKRILLCILALLLLVPLLVACAEKENCDPETLCGTYKRPNANGFDSFSITLNEDGTYQYFETMISSHLGFGSYKIEGNTVTMTEKNIPGLYGSLTHTYRFEYTDGKLIYLADQSDRFIYIDLPQGAEFTRERE